jgi:2-hydroxychromene-2-carboxylate isomerase
MIDLASDCRVCWDEAENVLDGEGFWGQDRIELLADALKSGRALHRSQA